MPLYFPCQQVLSLPLPSRTAVDETAVWSSSIFSCVAVQTRALRCGKYSVKTYALLRLVTNPACRFLDDAQRVHLVFLNVLAGKQGWRWRHAARCSAMERFVTKHSSSITMATCYSEDARTALKHSRVWGRLLSVSLWRRLCATFSNSLQPPVVCCCSTSFLHPLSDAV